MTLVQWSEIYNGYIGNHESGAKYIAGSVYLAECAYKKLWTLSDFRVSSVLGGTIWLLRK